MVRIIFDRSMFSSIINEIISEMKNRIDSLKALIVGLSYFSKMGVWMSRLWWFL